MDLASTALLWSDSEPLFKNLASTASLWLIRGLAPAFKNMLRRLVASPRATVGGELIISLVPFNIFDFTGFGLCSGRGAKLASCRKTIGSPQDLALAAASSWPGSRWHAASALISNNRKMETDTTDTASALNNCIL